MPDADYKLAQRCARNERAAQHELYERFKPPLFRLCLRYGRDSQEAEDILHEAFLLALRDIGQYRGEGPLGGWLRRLTLNTALRQLRASRHWVAIDDAPETGEDPEEIELPPPPSMAELLRHVQALPPGYRTVFNLYVLDQHTHQEIADLLGISVGASKSQLAKAKAMLRRRLSGTTVPIDS